MFNRKLFTARKNTDKRHAIEMAFPSKFNIETYQHYIKEQIEEQTLKRKLEIFTIRMLKILTITCTISLVSLYNKSVHIINENQNKPKKKEKKKKT